MYRPLFAILLIAALALPTFAQEATTELEANLTEECVTEYDASVDYFPEKVEITEAENLTVTYSNNYKHVTVADAFFDAPVFDYVLVQCGTPAPDAEDFPEGTQFIEVPTGNLISLTTTELPFVTELGLLDHLVGVDSIMFVSTPEVIERYDEGEIVEVGSGSTINLEQVLNTDPDLVITNGYNPDTDAHPVLLEAGIFTALLAEYREATPLGQAEWIKYTALFYNEEARANEVYDEVAASYNEARELAASVPEDERPTVLWNALSTYDNTWSIPGAETFPGHLIQDAGGQIAMGEEAQSDSAYLGFEAVYEGALEADVWIANLFGINTLDEVLAIDPRYADFAPVINGNTWNNDLDTNINGGNNYYELGVIHPDLVLKDLVAIFHPDLMPDHEFTFYRQIPAGE